MTRDEFERAIETVDNELKDRDVPIHARPIVALREIAKRLNVQEDIPLTTLVVDCDDFSAPALGGQVHDWYERCYGKRLSVNMGPGSTLISIRGDVWEMKLFGGVGRISLVCDPSALGDRRPRRAPGGGAVCNVLNAIIDLPQQLAHGLTHDERTNLLVTYRSAWQILAAVRNESDSLLVPEALSDLTAGVRRVMDERAYAQSKFESLQFAEKLMKSRLLKAGIAFDKKHNLTRLRVAVEQLGHAVAQTDIDVVQCGGGVRYDEVSVSRDEAVRAHQAALRIALSLGFGRGSAP